MKKKVNVQPDFDLLDQGQKDFIQDKVQRLYSAGGGDRVLINYRRNDLISLYARTILEKIEEEV